jgi:hypothetical protein
MRPFAISEELRRFLEGGVSILVATRDARLRPTATRATGLGVTGSAELWILLPHATAARALADLRQNGEVAISCSSPLDFRTVQLKGRCVEIGEPDAEDRARSAAWPAAFAAAIARFGMTRQQARNLWMAGGARVRVAVEAAYRQTPGPGAGGPLLPSGGAP